MSTILVCRTCGNAFSDVRPQSMGNPNACVPCACGISIDSTPSRSVEAGGRWTPSFRRKFKCSDGLCGALDCPRCNPNQQEDDE